MNNPNLHDVIKEICATDSRYPENAYHFIREALDFTVKNLGRPVEGAGRHVSGGELLDGIREYTLNEYGAMTKTVLDHWCIRTTEDFGNLVFNLVEKGVLGKTDDDKHEDFLNGFDFDKAFVTPFQAGGQNTSILSAADQKED